MKRPLAIALLSLFLTFGPHSARGGSVTYYFPNDVTLQNGYDMIGSVTTDGKVGTLSALDIVDWSLSVSNGSPFGYTFAPAYGFADVLGLVATSAGALELTQPPETGLGVIDQLTFEGTDTPGNTGNISWTFGSAIDGNHYDLFTTYSTISPYGGVPWIVGNNFPTPGEPWVIAQAGSVPEPGTLTLVLIGSSCLALVRWLGWPGRTDRPRIWCSPHHKIRHGVVAR